MISAHRARRCAYVVCVRHQQGPYKAEGNEPHKHAFLIGKVSGVEPSDEEEDRFRVEFSEYAILQGPHIPLNSASPTQYFPSLSSIGINEAALDWKPVSNLPGEDIGSVPTQVPPSGNCSDDAGDAAPMSVIAQAKKLVADGLQVPLSSVEIIVRA
ncbi:hypothetical protein Y590_18308 [Methylobacterium sp. AMS5]|nr:hypothetical protein Y590_18308 [Methylobacterium sp. AMS5]